MTILGIRTDKPEAELYIYDNDKKLAELKWQAHRELAETLNSKIEEISAAGGLSISYDDLGGVAIYKGPGSFTGLRIGMSVANALVYAQSIPIIATGGEDWLKKSIKDLLAGKNHKNVIPEYGVPPRTTTSRK